LQPVSPRPAAAPAPSQPQPTPARKIGRVIAVSGCNAQIELMPAAPGAAPPRAEIGSLARIHAQNVAVVGIICGMTVQPAGTRGETVILDLVLVGEIQSTGFHRGVAHFPSIGDEVSLAGGRDLSVVYAQPDRTTLNVGTLYQDPAVPTFKVVRSGWA
jgi:hypothetical protein